MPLQERCSESLLVHPLLASFRLAGAASDVWWRVLVLQWQLLWLTRAFLLGRGGAALGGAVFWQLGYRQLGVQV